MEKGFTRLFYLGIFTILSFFSWLASAAEEQIEEILIVGDQLFRDTANVSPTSVITAEELTAINMSTVEDALTYEPNLIVRRRFIGDPNGVIGMRGSNMFQGSRTMVFADGMPLHYHLQTRWSGSPRWSLVSPSEIEAAEIIYGPYSAEYSGNAMGGVVNLYTRNPTERKVNIETGFFSQSYDVLMTDESYIGNKLFASIEDRIGNTSYFLSFNRLDNEGQPQTQHRSSSSRRSASVTGALGAVSGLDERGRKIVYFGDSGPEESLTELVKFKIIHDMGEFQLRGNIAYEQRERDESNPNNYLKDSSGNVFYDRNFSLASDPSTVYDTTSWGTSVFQNRIQERGSLLVGFGIGGPLNESGWLFDAYFSNFEIIDDVEVRTGRHPNASDFQSANARFAGRITEFNDTGWQIFDFKVGTQALFGNDDMRLSLGVHTDNYELNVDPYRYDAFNGVKGSSRGSSGGEVSTKALYAQWGMALSEKWDLSLGIRYEDWESSGGYFGDQSNATDQHINRDENGISPKFSLAYFLDNSLTIRYSAARAIRFPIIEELYRNESSGVNQFAGNALLEPEDGLHHNLSIEKLLGAGSIGLNFYKETIDDVIFNFTEITNGTNISTALPVDEVDTEGIEFVYNNTELFNPNLSLRFNINFADAEITKSTLNPGIEGNEFPRMPKWRANALFNYSLSNEISIGLGFRHASNSYGRLDNLDKESNIFGAQDDFLLTNVRINWQFSDEFSVSSGIDNVTNEEVYVYHPWPSQTFFFEGKYSF
ncbi:MAG: TonB-dependent receptor [Pseudohongiellaceae bacterium]